MGFQSVVAQTEYSNHEKYFKNTHETFCSTIDNSSSGQHNIRERIFKAILKGRELDSRWASLKIPSGMFVRPSKIFFWDWYIYTPQTKILEDWATVGNSSPFFDNLHFGQIAKSVNHQSNPGWHFRRFVQNGDCRKKGTSCRLLRLINHSGMYFYAPQTKIWDGWTKNCVQPSEPSSPFFDNLHVEHFDKTSTWICDWNLYASQTKILENGTAGRARLFAVPRESS